MIQIFHTLRENRVLHRRLLNLTWPVIIAALSIPLAGAVDTAVVGHLPDPVYIGAVALGALIFSTIYWLAGFLRMGTTGFVAQAFGADNKQEITAAFARGSVIAVTVGGLILIIQYPLGQIIFWFFNASQAVEEYALSYYQIRIWGSIFAMFNLVVLGLLLGMQRMRTALVLQLLLNTTNIVLDLVFVVGFGWNVAGVAAATLISEVLTALVGAQVCFRLLGLRLDCLRDLNIFQREKMFILMQTNVNILVRSISLEIVFIYFMWVSAQQGDLILAGNAILLHLLTFLAFGLDGFAHAAEALAGSAYGMKDRKRLRDTVIVALYWSCITALAFSLVYWLIGDLIIGLLTTIESVSEIAHDYLFWMVIAPFFCIWPFLFDGIYIGTTRTVEMRNSMLIAMVAFFVVAYPAVMLFGNHGIWLGMLVFMSVRGLILGLWYPRIEASLEAN